MYSSVALIPPSGIPRCPRSTQVASYRNLMKWAEQVHFRDAGSIFGSLELGKTQTTLKCARSVHVQKQPASLAPPLVGADHLPSLTTCRHPQRYRGNPAIVSTVSRDCFTLSCRGNHMLSNVTHGSRTPPQTGAQQCTRNILTISPSDSRSVTRLLSPASSPERHRDGANKRSSCGRAGE